jgi:hypothetical protein
MRADQKPEEHADAEGGLGGAVPSAEAQADAGDEGTRDSGQQVSGVECLDGQIAQQPVRNELCREECEGENEHDHRRPRDVVDVLDVVRREQDADDRDVGGERSVDGVLPVGCECA